jgi:Ca2+-binding EF-hand superfamily protein
VFEDLDRDGDGLVTCDDVAKMFSRLDYALPPEAVAALVQQVRGATAS